VRRTLSLNVKLGTWLFVVQTVVLTLGVSWLGHLVKKARTRDLERQLDTLGDAVEGAIIFPNGVATLDATNESVRELFNDKNFYFEFIDSHGGIIAEGIGPAPEVRESLKKSFDTAHDPESFYRAKLKTGRWLIQSEPLTRDNKGQERIGYAHMAVNAQPLLDEISTFKRYIGLGAIFVLFVTGVASTVVVSLTTRNIRAFARRIRDISPPKFLGNISLSPQSSEESLLFDSYDNLIRAVRSSAETQRLFIAHASHELKTPIAAAFSALEVTLGKPRTIAEYQRICVDVFGELKTLRRLSTSLLDLARLESGSDKIGNEKINILAVATGASQRWQKVADEKMIHIEPIIRPESSDFLVSGSLGEWEIVFNNLIDNAIKYGRNGGRVTIGINCDDDKACEITVADDGCGMTEGQVARLGELFYRADSSRTGGESFGLGFAHAQRILENIGARVHVESAPGRGTVIKIIANRPKV